MTGRYRRHPSVSVTEIDGEAFLVRRDTDAILHLNPTATGLWRALEEPMARDRLVDLFASGFPDVSRTTLAADVDAALAALLAAGMITDDVP